MDKEMRSALLSLLCFGLGIATTVYLVLFRLEGFSIKGIFLSLVAGGLVLVVSLKLFEMTGLIAVDEEMSEDDRAGQ